MAKLEENLKKNKTMKEFKIINLMIENNFNSMKNNKCLKEKKILQKIKKVMKIKLFSNAKYLMKMDLNW